LRCIPQVLGAVRSALSDAAVALRIEMNAATDNPLIFPEGMSVSGGNFHAQALAMALDHVALGLAVLSGFSARRMARLGATPLRAGHGPRSDIAFDRSAVPPLDEYRSLAGDANRIREWLATGQFLEAAEKAAGRLA